MEKLFKNVVNKCERREKLLKDAMLGFIGHKISDEELTLCKGVNGVAESRVMLDIVDGRVGFRVVLYEKSDNGVIVERTLSRHSFSKDEYQESLKLLMEVSSRKNIENLDLYVPSFSF